MRLDQALVARHLCESRTEAQEMILSSSVLVNGTVVTKQTKQIVETDSLQVTRTRKYVSRGGDKLAGIFLDIFGSIEEVQKICKGVTALDIGSSTGGFTDYLLQNGVAHVDAVDVGTAQLHHTLMQDQRVSLYENTDIRSFVSKTIYDIVVGDLSFIPLHMVLKKTIAYGASGTYFFLLIKPQFEVGKGNTKKGIVRDKALVEQLMSTYRKEGEKVGLQDVEIVPCRLQGGDGNQEYFLYGILK